MNNAPRGRKPTPAAQPSDAPVLDEALLGQDLARLDRIESAYSEERDLVNQLLGQIQLADAFGKFSATVATSKLAYVKEIKAYRSLAGKKTGDGRQFAGTWDEFCELLGSSRRKIDEDIQNLKALGEEALESMSRMGIGYRELRQYRRLPAEAQTALIEAAKDGDKEGLLDLAEELIARQQREKAALTAELEDVRADNAAKDARAQTREREIERLGRDLASARGERDRATPTEAAERLRTQLGAAGYQARLDIGARGADADSVYNRIRMLLELPADDAGGAAANAEYAAGVIGEIFTALRVVRDEFELPIVNDHGAPGVPGV